MLKLKNIEKSFKNLHILNDINLTIKEPRLIALIAPNGSGKTTLLNIICNLEKPDSGRVSIMGLENTDIEIFKYTTYMQDNTILYPNLTGRDHIKLIQQLHLINDSQVEKILTELNMLNYIDRRVKSYSLGMKQNLLFALSIIPEPKIILMDEPLNGLDPASIVRVRNKLIELYEKGATIIFSSHNLDQINKLTTDIYFLKDKQLLSYDQIKQSTINRIYQVVVDNPEKLTEYLKMRNIKFKRIATNKLELICKKKELDIIQARSSIKILDLATVDIELEEIYFNLYEDYNYDNT